MFFFQQDYKTYAEDGKDPSGLSCACFVKQFPKDNMLSFQWVLSFIYRSQEEKCKFLCKYEFQKTWTLKQSDSLDALQTLQSSELPEAKLWVIAVLHSEF